MSDSILTSVKKLIGIDEEYTHFDPDIIIHINTTMLSLNQLGVGPADGFMITGKDETWSDLIGERKDLVAVKTYVYLKARLVFDPPSSSFVIESMERQIKETEWRLSIQVDTPVVEGGTENGG